MSNQYIENTSALLQFTEHGIQGLNALEMVAYMYADDVVEQNDEMNQVDEQPDGFIDINLIQNILDVQTNGDVFIPNQTQVDLLNTQIDSGLNNPGKLSNRQWHDQLWAQDGGVLFQHPRHIHVQQILHDQIVRANAIVQRMIERQFTSIYMMDGHGRFLLCFIHALIEAGQDPDEYDINIIDIDPYAHRWHELFFPNVSVSPNNILTLLSESINFAENMEEDGDIELPNPETTFFYLNFCSIGESVTTFGIDEFIDLMRLYHRLNNTMLSFTVRAMTNNGEIGIMVRDVIAPMWTFVSNRGMFFSGFI